MINRCVTGAVLVSLVPIGPVVAQVETIQILDRGVVHWSGDQVVDADGNILFFPGQSIDTPIELPVASDMNSARRITVRLDVEPITHSEDGHEIANDPWTRLGSFAVLIPSGSDREPAQVELMRFITPYGGPASFEQDLTALAPLLQGKKTLRTTISSFSEEPSWRVSVTLSYSDVGAGHRRPFFAKQLFRNEHVTAEDNILIGTVEIPPNVERPRLRIITTGHATDGAAENEFVSCSHILKVGDRTIARWRPWSEEGGLLRDLNPQSGRQVIEGRALWSSDLDRSGWHPGLAVEPLLIPIPELTPREAPHTVELRIVGIRRTDADGHHGYFNVSAVVVADERWPREEIADPEGDP